MMWVDVASVKHYLNAIKAKQSALSARKPLVGGREHGPINRTRSIYRSMVGNPTSALGPSGLAPTGIHHLLLSNLTTAVV